ALSDVGPPVRAAPAPHGGQNSLAQHKEPQVTTIMRNEALQVDYRADVLQGVADTPASIYIGDLDDAPAFVAEQRFDDDVTAQALERFQRGVGILAYFGIRHEQASGGEAGGAEVFIDARFQRLGRVHDNGAIRGTALQHIHTKDDLLQRSGRHGADEDR